MTTPILGLPELTPGQATPETTVNEQIYGLEGFASLTVLKDRDLATPPGSPAQGDRYLVAASPTGAWTGKAGQIARYQNTAWEFHSAFEGLFAWIVDEATLVRYHGGAWGAAQYTDEQARDTIAAALASGDGITVTPNDGADTIALNWDGGAVNVGTPADGDVLTWDNTAGEWVSAPALGSGGGGTVPDGGSTGQVLTKDSNIDQDVSWQDAVGPDWTLVSSTSPSAASSVDVNGLGSYNELLVVARDLTATVSNVRCIQVSTDNGATFDSTVGNYLQIGQSGAPSNADVPAIAYHGTNSTAARTLIAHILNLKGPVKVCNCFNYVSGRGSLIYVGSASDINAISVLNAGGGTISGGPVYVYAR